MTEYPTVYCSGKHGDVIWSLAAVKAWVVARGYDSVDYLLRQTYPFYDVREGEALLSTLLMQQPYIHSVRARLDGTLPDHATSCAPWWLDSYRAGKLPKDGSWNLATLSCDHMNVGRTHADEPWLSSVALPKAEFVIARNTQAHCHNEHMPWPEIMAATKGRSLFVGHKSEHYAFQDEFGSIPFYQIRDLAESAALIKGARAFIGNQSCHHAVAEGLKAPVCLEVCQEYPSVIFNRPDVVNVWNEKTDWPTIQSGLRLD